MVFGVVSRGGIMCLKLMPTTAFAFALAFIAIVHPRIAVSATGDDLNRLVQAAYFSEACRREAGALGIGPSSDANALLASFATLRKRPAVGSGVEQLDDCLAR